MFVADDLGAWLVGLLADAGRRRLVTWTLGTDQERALWRAATAAIQHTAAELCPNDDVQAEQLAMVIDQVFTAPGKAFLPDKSATLLEGLQAEVAGQLAPLDDADLTGTGRSSADLLGVPAGLLAEELTGHLVREIVIQAARGGPLQPLAAQLNHDATHLQGQRLEQMFGQLAKSVQDALARTTRSPGDASAGVAVRLAPRPVFLVGREDLLAELDARLTGRQTGPPIVALYGLGGVGKTSVAVEYAHRHLEECAVVWQLVAQEPAALAAGFSELAAQLGARDGPGAGDPVAQVHAALARRSDWLLVFDNVTDPPAINGLLPPAGGGRVLVTSQYPNWPSGQGLEVPVLDHAKAAEFLMTRTGASTKEEEAAGELARELGGLPLALEQAAAYMQATGRNLPDYLGLFRKRRLELLARGDPAGYDKRVATTWTLAFAKLGGGGPAAGLLRLAACCATEDIPLSLLLRLGPGLAEAFAAEVASLLVPLLEDPVARDDAVAGLRRYSLISAPRDGLVSVHRLVQAITLAQLPPDVAADWQQATAAVIEAALPEDADDPAHWQAFAALLPHAQIALTPASYGMDKIATYLRAIGDYGAALGLQAQILDACQADLGGEHPRALTASARLATLTGETGDAGSARDRYAALVPVMTQVLGAEHPATLAARTSLAYWTGMAGDPAAARDQYAALVPVMTQVLGAEHRATLAALSNLTRLTGDTGNPAAARDQFAKLLSIREQVSGAEHPATLTARASLAYWTGEAGDPAAARDQYAALVPVRQQVLGPEHPRTLTARGNLARWTGEAGDSAAARDQYAALLPVLERVLGEEHPDTLTVRANLARWTREAVTGTGHDVN